MPKKTKPQALKELEALLAQVLPVAQASGDIDIVTDLFTTIHRLLTAQVDRGDMKLISRALQELRYAFDTFSAYRQLRKVTVFGSARTKEDDPAYKQAVAFARAMVEQGYMVITGAGEGIMRGAQEGAGREQSFGVNIELPFEQAPNAFIHEDPKLIACKYFFTRKLIFVKESHALALFPGGWGTMDEGFEVLTLQQTGKSAPMPIVFVDEPGGSYWSEWREYNVQHLLKRNLISAEDLHLFIITDHPETAVKEILTFYKNYHSSRYVHGRLVFRLNRPVPDALLDAINHDFADLVSQGKIEQGPALPEERNEHELVNLPRLMFWFNRKNSGRLRQLIDAINQGY
ncbi:MAG: LOG family protein [Nitrospiria bacterium]